MPHEIVIWLDCSTTTCKAPASDRQGRVVAESRATFEELTPHPGWHGDTGQAIEARIILGGRSSSELWMLVSYGDRYHLHCGSGGTWVDAAWQLATDVREQLFSHVEARGRRDPQAIAVLGKLLLLAGLSVSVPDESAPLSGYEHVTGHLFDPAAVDVWARARHSTAAAVPRRVGVTALAQRAPRAST